MEKRNRRRRNNAGLSSPMGSAGNSMSRSGFLKGLGVGAAALGAAAVGLGGTAAAYTPPEGPGAVTVHFGVKYDSVPCYGNAFFVSARDDETGLMMAALGKDPDDPALSQTVSEGVGVFLPDKIEDYFDYPGLADIVNMRTSEVPVVVWKNVPSLTVPHPVIPGQYLTLSPNDIIGVAFNTTLSRHMYLISTNPQPDPDVVFYISQGYTQQLAVYVVSLKRALNELKDGTMTIWNILYAPQNTPPFIKLINNPNLVLGMELPINLNLYSPVYLYNLLVARGDASLHIVRTSVKQSNIVASGQGALDMVSYNPQTQQVEDSGSDKLAIMTVVGIAGIATSPLTGAPIIDLLSGNPWVTVEQIKHLQVKLIPEDE